ncbi:tRNA pseudouridine(55) synthase TruB [Alteribacillus sp. HJP-4]|uniref:tRNA pseudouridine(55) synthase TruB n=1 Tax=Alteribacillus sp. HJP-4 TaxID=2775394 RepID=UPI0035CD22D3
MDGLLPLFKEKGMTSHDCVMKIRRIFETKRVGHTGTLDPDVEGVLPICLGKATKAADYITLLPKQYEAEITLGFATDTEDASGIITSSKAVKEDIDASSIQKVLEGFQGRQQQVPPMYSALKVKGRKLYEYAREGIEVKREPRPIEVYDISYLEESLKVKERLVTFRFKVSCSKGTYIRTLSVDIGKRLGYPAHMSDLIRTSSGPFQLTHCVTLAELNQLKEFGELERAVIPIAEALSYLPYIEIGEELAEKVKNGAVLPAFPEVKEPMFMILYNKKALAVYEEHPNKPGRIKPKTMLISESS